jgi:hypothetical protein
MKQTGRFIAAVSILLVAFVGISSCKKKSETPVTPYIPSTPVFTITYITLPLQGGGDGFQFTAKCINNGVKMTKATITDPTSFALIYNYSGGSYAQNASIPLQDNDAAYEKKLGTWSFSLVGTRTADGVAFTVDTTLIISK